MIQYKILLWERSFCGEIFRASCYVIFTLYIYVRSVSKIFKCQFFSYFRTFIETSIKTMDALRQHSSPHPGSLVPDLEIVGGNPGGLYSPPPPQPGGGDNPPPPISQFLCLGGALPPYQTRSLVHAHIRAQWEGGGGSSVAGWWGIQGYQGYVGLPSFVVEDTKVPGASGIHVNKARAKNSSVSTVQNQPNG